MAFGIVSLGYASAVARDTDIALSALETCGDALRSQRWNKGIASDHP